MAKPRVLIIGLDGVGLDLVEQFILLGHLPNLKSLMSRGLRSPLKSTTPPTTLPAWTSFVTGAEPSSHGLADFTVRSGYSVRFVGGASRCLPTIFSNFENSGLTAGSAWFPASYPPERLNGYQISGWDCPVTEKGDKSFVHPPDLHDELRRNFGNDHLEFDTIDEFSDDRGWYFSTASALPRHVLRRAEMALWLLKNRPTDVAAFYFGEADTAAHHFWAFHDPTSPRRPKNVDARLEKALLDVYSALDEAVGQLIEAAGQQASVVLLSDHGSGGASDVAVHLNRMLESAGLLHFKNGPSTLLGPEILRGKAPRLVPLGLRRMLFRLAGGFAPSKVESYLRFHQIDWRRTIAFSEELSYAPSVWFNQLGREPKGVLRHSEREKAALAVERAASALRVPDGSALVSQVIRREDLHRGPYAHLFPDIVIELERPGGYTPLSLPSMGRSGEVVTRIEGKDLLGRKGRSMPGCHTREGILAATGPGIPADTRVSAHIMDVAPLVTDLAGTPRAPWFQGTSPVCLPETKAVIGTIPRFSAAKSTSSTYTAAEERAVAERLKRLGYLEG